MDRLLARPEHPSALFVTADRTALGVVHRLLARGVRVPGGLAVVGYDIPCAACAQVPLTTVAVAARELGELAAEILFDRLDGGSAPRVPEAVRNGLTQEEDPCARRPDG